MASDLNPLTRFTDRVDDYVRYRPSYPAELIAALRREVSLGPDATVADVGSGTGIFSRLLLDTGAKVYAVEPNDAMRDAATRQLGGHARFVAVAGTGEATTLPDASVNLVACAQAFHWLDAALARKEFLRITRPGGHWALVWNTTVIESEFARGYEQVKTEYGTDFSRVRHENEERRGRFDTLFGPGGWRRESFPNHQDLDWEGLRGRLLSSSYAPGPGDPRHEPMLAALRRLYEATAVEGKIRMAYHTELILGPAR